MNKDGSPELTEAAPRRRKSGQDINLQRETDEFYQKARDEVDDLTHHDPHLKKIVESIRGILREQDQKRNNETVYTPPKRPGLLYGAPARFKNLTSRKNDT